MKILKLVAPSNDGPQKQTVAVLSDFLKLAEAGEVTEVALVAIYSDQRHELVFTPSKLSALMLGAVCRLQHKLSEAINEQEYESGDEV